MRKWYLTRGMLRAGRALVVASRPLSASVLDPAGHYRYLGTATRYALHRDGLGVPKAFARLCAGIEPARLCLWGCDEAEARAMLSQANSVIAAADELCLLTPAVCAAIVAQTSGLQHRHSAADTKPFPWTEAGPPPPGDGLPASWDRMHQP